MTSNSNPPKSADKGTMPPGKAPTKNHQSFWANLQRMLYRTPQDVINEIGVRDDQGNLDEKIQHVCYHHWILLLRSELLPVIIALLLGWFFSIRLTGYTFLGVQADSAGQMDLFNTILLALVLAVGLIWLIVPAAASNKRQSRQVLVVIGSILAGLFAFRYLFGGRLFIYSGISVANTFDPTNTLLLLGFLGAALAMIYIYLDWSNDFLILTNKRVIYDDEKLFVSRVQDQLVIEDVKSVRVNTGSHDLRGYAQHLLNAGTVEVQSASFREPIIFRTAQNPRAVQEKIDAAVKALQKTKTQEAYTRIIKKIMQSDDQAAAQPAKQPAAGPIKTKHAMGGLLGENPDVADDGTITWRPHSIFALAALSRPTGALLLGLILVYILRQMGLELIPPFWLGVILVVAMILFWAIWIYEDYRNDLYILKPTQVIDVEKLPFGPESRRTASLGALQNVQLKTSFIGRIIGYGDVELETAGGGPKSKLTFHGVPQPYEVVARINQYLADFRRGEKERTLAETTALLDTFYKNLPNEIRNG